MNELRPSKDLLDPKFDGYKLSLTSLPVHKIQLNESVDVVEPSEDQYSFLHLREFSLHNHLHSDPWSSHAVYFIDKHWNINKINIDALSGRPDGVTPVFHIPGLQNRLGGEFNVSMLFPSENLVVIGDGFKNLLILKTPGRKKSSLNWELLHTEKIFEDHRPFHLMDSHYDGRTTKLHCVVLHVELKDKEEFEADRKENKNTSKYETGLQWVIFKMDMTKYCWTVERNEELRGRGKAEYVAFETGGKALYLASENKFKFPRLEHSKNEEVPPPPENGDKIDYQWQQSFDDITLFFDDVSTAEGVSVNINQKSVLVKHCDNVLLSGNLIRNVSGELTTWTLKESRLEIVLQKSETGTMWPKLLSDPKSNDERCFVGKEIIDPELAAEIGERLSHLTSENVDNGCGVINDWQMEECDVFDEDSTTLFRFECDSPEPTHKILVGGSKWLFTVRTGGASTVSMCIRNDVDGCVWRPSPPDGSLWPVAHIGTFFAFGYILASKVNRKFTVAPPDLSYVSVIDDTGHVIIYRKGVAVGGELRNRKTNRQVESIATQSMINLQTKDNIVGAAADSSYLFVLTTNSLHLICIQ